jgi:hypothetical protein
MSQEREDEVIGRALRQRTDAERAFYLLDDEVDDVSTKLMRLASDLRNDPKKITKGREFVTDQLFQLAQTFVQAKDAYKETDKKAAKWLPSGTPRPVFNDLSE